MADKIFESIFEAVTNEMMKKINKTNMKISIEDAKTFYLSKEKEEKEFLTVIILLPRIKVLNDADPEVICLMVENSRMEFLKVN